MTLKSDLKKAIVTGNTIDQIAKFFGVKQNNSINDLGEEKYISLSALKKICEEKEFCYFELSDAISEIEKEEKE